MLSHCSEIATFPAASHDFLLPPVLRLDQCRTSTGLGLRREQEESLPQLVSADSFSEDFGLFVILPLLIEDSVTEFAK